MDNDARQFRHWLTFCISCARSVPDALDPQAARILENVRDKFDACFPALATLHTPPPVATATVVEDVLTTLRQYVDDMRYPPDSDSRPRRIAAAERVIANLTANQENDR